MAVLSAAVAALGWRFLPRLLVKAVGDRMYLREEFLHPVTYRAGGFTVAGFTFGGRVVDCSRMEASRAATGRNLLVGEGLDSPCGWTFVPHLGGKLRRDAEASAGVCFCPGNAGESILQVVDLAPVGDLAAAGMLRATLTGRVKGALADLGLDLLSEADSRGLASTSLRPVELPPGPGWRPVAVSGAVSSDTRALRVVLRQRPGRGALLGPDACFDDLSLVLERR